MKIVLAGASGFLGSHLRACLADGGHDLVQLVRRPPRSGEVRWDPEAGSLDPAVLAGAGAVVNLCGAGVEDHRWTDAYRRELRSSRVSPTSSLAHALALLPPAQRPTVLLNASAVGYYGDTGDKVVDESAAPGTGFFPDLCQAWEAA